MAEADEPQSPIIENLRPIIVIGTRKEEPLLNIPYMASSLSQNQLRERAVRTLPEALRETPGVLVQKTAHGHGSPFIRGLTSFRNLALIDGIRFNHAAFRDGPNQYWNTIDPYSAHSIELVKGQGSTLFGSDAMGGALNVTTKRPDYARSGFLTTGTVYGRYSSAEDSYIGRVESSVSDRDRYGLFVGVTSKDFGELKAADLGRLPNTDYEEWDFDTKYEYFLKPDLQLTLYHQQVHQNDVWRTHRTIFSPSWEGTTAGSDNSRIFDQDRWLTYLQLRGAIDSPIADKLAVSLSHQWHGETRFRERGDERTEIQGFDIDTYGASVQLDKESSIGSWVYGASYYQDVADTFRTDFNADGSLRARRIQGPVGDDATYHLAAAYAQDQIEVTDRLDVYIGGRYTFAEADIDRVEDPQTGTQTQINDSWASMVGNVRALYNLDSYEENKVFLGVSQGFRAPNFSDLSRLDTSRSNEIETPSAGLDPERLLTYEGGWIGDFSFLQGGVSYYYSDVNDFIVRTPTGRVIEGDNEVTKQNAGDGYIQGFEVWWDWEFAPQFSFFGNFAWQEGELDTYPTSAPIKVREPKSKMLPTTGQVGLRWAKPDRGLWVEGLVTIAAKQDQLNTRDLGDTQRIPPGGTPGYVVATVRGGWSVTEDFLTTIAVENIFNEDYRVHGSGQNEPGINLVLGAEFTF